MGARRFADLACLFLQCAGLWPQAPVGGLLRVSGLGRDLRLAAARAASVSRRRRRRRRDSSRASPSARSPCICRYILPTDFVGQAQCTFRLVQSIMCSPASAVPLALTLGQAANLSCTLSGHVARGCMQPSQQYTKSSMLKVASLTHPAAGPATAKEDPDGESFNKIALHLQAAAAMELDAAGEDPDGNELSRTPGILHSPHRLLFRVLVISFVPSTLQRTQTWWRRTQTASLPGARGRRRPPPARA